MECQFCALQIGEHTTGAQGICGRCAAQLHRRLAVVEQQLSILEAERAVRDTSAAYRAAHAEQYARVLAGMEER